ncbi:hypothetical protein GLOTRDRAFT_78904, partial [Gloeophyllum trabeum ATCC 11539]
MKKLAARDFEDILQCAYPCFEGLLPSPHNEHVLDVLYLLAEWHALAKLRMHTDTSLQLLDSATTALGKKLRSFKSGTCAAFDTRETERECAARARADARRQAGSGAANPSSAATASGRRHRTLNLQRYKLHALGDYVDTIRCLGTTDSYSTQTVRRELSLLLAHCGNDDSVRTRASNCQSEL